MKIRAFLLTALFTFCTYASAQGFDEHYKAYSGDLNSDGYIDIYIRQEPQLVLIHGDIITPIVLLPDVNEFVLQQNTDQTFSIVSNLTNPQRNAVSQWQEAAIDLVIGDLNADGFLDLVLRDMGQIAPGVDNQIVFASTTTRSAPLYNRAIDTEYAEFFGQVFEWLKNPNYYDENAPIVTSPQTINDYLWLAEYCATPEYVAENGPLANKPPLGTLYGDSLEDIYSTVDRFVKDCNTKGLTVIHYDFISVQYQIPIGGRDYSVFNQSALALLDTGFRRVPTSQGQLILEAIVIIGQILFPELSEQLDDILNPEILDVISDDTGISDEKKAQILIIILNNICTSAGSAEDCIVNVEEALQVQLERGDIDDDKLDLDALARWIEVLRQAEAKRSRDPNRLHCSYIKQNLSGTEFYYGRTSGFADNCAELVRLRDARHDSLKGLEPAYVDRSATGIGGYSSIRGREQQLIDSHVYDLDSLSWTSETHGLQLSPHRVKNKIRGVARNNPLGCAYWLASTTLWIEKGPYTGFRPTAVCSPIPMFPEDY